MLGFHFTEGQAFCLGNKSSLLLHQILASIVPSIDLVGVLKLMLTYSVFLWVMIELTITMESDYGFLITEL